jgi:amino acid transporter
VIGGRRPIRGRKLADRRVQAARPHAPYFRYGGPGQLVAREAASVPTSGAGRAFARLKSLLIGRPLPSEAEILERLPKRKALAIFSSDAISSSAYATEEVLRVLILGGAAALLFAPEIAAAIAILLAVVAISYRQVCRAYPTGGGAYSVARENLGAVFALIAAAALLIDYVLTVAVSTASAIAQLVSIVPQLYVVGVEIGVAAIAIITIANLRGLRESGNIFAIPTYAFVVGALAIVAIGLVQVATGQATRIEQPEALPVPDVVGTAGVLLLLRAFASGSVALTGVEAIANGVPAFKPPESRNAADTMVVMAVLLAVIFIGITVIANAYGIRPSEEGGPTVIALVAGTVFGAGSPVFYLFQVATALILFLAANTSFNAFPRLAALLAADGYIPRQFSFRGDRLAYSWGIIVLAGVAAILLIVFGGDTHALIPLYSVGVFVCFTLSQIGMVRHWYATRDPGWRWRAGVNAMGGTLTFVVLLVVASAKFADGAWLVVLLIPIEVAVMMFIARQYRSTRGQLAIRYGAIIPEPTRQERIVVPVSGLDRSVVQAINVARSIGQDIRGVFVTDEPAAGHRLRAEWEAQIADVPLVVVESPYRALVHPLLAYLEVLDASWPPDRPAPVTFVVIPEFVARRWWERILYNQSAQRLRRALLGRTHTVVVNVPYRRERGSEATVTDGSPGRQSPPA